MQRTELFANPQCRHDACMEVWNNKAIRLVVKDTGVNTIMLWLSFLAYLFNVCNVDHICALLNEDSVRNRTVVSLNSLYICMYSCQCVMLFQQWKLFSLATTWLHLQWC